VTDPNTHLGDRLTAFADGELGADEPAVRAHVAGCPVCAAELAQIREVRALLRGLPVVEAPFGFYERMLRRKGGRRGLVGVAAGVAAAIAVLTLVTPQQGDVQPPVADMVETHAATASVAGDPVSQLVPAATPVRFDP
jgi:anti-sigma factor RsiW